MKYLLLIVCAASWTGISGAEEAAVYREQTLDKSILITSREKRTEDGYILSAESENGESHLITLNRDLETLSWTYRSEDTGTAYTAVRQGSGVRVSGMLKGEQSSRNLPLDGLPWIQSIEKSLEPLALGSRREELRFRVINPYTLDIQTLVARREGRKSLDLPIGTVEAVRIRITLPGFLSVFWSASYWYRLSDGKMVFHEGTRGPPGTAVTRVTLISEGGG